MEFQRNRHSYEGGNPALTRIILYFCLGRNDLHGNKFIQSGDYDDRHRIRYSGRHPGNARRVARFLLSGSATTP
jgi:hypothetical protein